VAVQRVEVRHDEFHFTVAKAVLAQAAIAGALGTTADGMA
jgi:hypothetical protein